MNACDLFIKSDEALTAIVDQIRDYQWGLKVPKTITDKDKTVKEIINYHAYDESWVPDVLDGKTIAEVGTKFDGDLLGDNPKVSWHRIVDTTIGAVRNVNDEEKIVHLSYGDFKTKEYLWHISTFRAFRAVDFARFLGFDDTLPDDLVTAMSDMLTPNIEDWRKMGVFGPPVAVDPSDTPQAKLLGMVGRAPHK